MKQKKNLFQLTLFFVLFLSINSAVVAQDAICDNLMNEGITYFEAEQFADAKMIFEMAKKRNCTNAQSWIDKCNAIPIPPSQTPCTQLWESGEEAYIKGDYSEAMIRFKEFEAKKCKKSPLQETELQNYLTNCEENILCAALWKLGEDALNKEDWSMADIWFKEFEARNCKKSSLQETQLPIYLKKIDSELNPYLILTLTNREFDAEGGEIEIGVTTNQDTWWFNQKDSDPWLSLSPKDSVLKIVCNPNETIDIRNATFTVEAGKAGKIKKIEQSVSIKQTAMPDWNEIFNLLKNNLESNPVLSTSVSNYKGELKKGRRHGLGAFQWKNEGAFYVGGWKWNGVKNDNGARSGDGIKIPPIGVDEDHCKDCAFYVGAWEAGNKQGFGRCYDKYGKLIYEGNFEEDKPVETYPNITNDEPFSFVLIKYPNGNRYAGEVQKGKPHGLGIFFFKQDQDMKYDMWYGTFQDDKRSGKGIYIPFLLKGKISAGCWDGDRKVRCQDDNK